MRTDSGISSVGNPEQGTGLPGKTFFVFTLLIGTLLVGIGMSFLRLEYNIVSEGTIHAQNERCIYAPSGERLSKVNITVGQQVKAGDLLFQLDQTEINLEIVRLEENLIKTQHELSEVETSIQDSLASPSDRQVAITEKEMGALKSRKTHLKKLCEHMAYEIQLLKQRKDSMNVTSPIDGVIAEVDYRHVGMTPSKGDRLAKIIQRDGHYLVKTWLNQRNYDLIEPGLPVRMESQVFNSTLEGYITGRIVHAGPDADTSHSQHGDPLYEVWIEVLKSPYLLLHGSQVKVNVQMGKVPVWRTLFQLPEQRRNQYTAPEQS
jgi:multidrug resistance efflux pump